MCFTEMMYAHIDTGEGNKLKFMQQMNERCPAKINTASMSSRNMKKILLNLMAASTQCSNSNWAWCPRSNNNNALLSKDGEGGGMFAVCEVESGTILLGAIMSKDCLSF